MDQLTGCDQAQQGLCDRHIAESLMEAVKGPWLVYRLNGCNYFSVYPLAFFETCDIGSGEFSCQRRFVLKLSVSLAIGGEGRGMAANLIIGIVNQIAFDPFRNLFGTWGDSVPILEGSWCGGGIIPTTDAPGGNGPCVDGGGINRLFTFVGTSAEVQV
jgi:hypothetical protein